MKEGGKEGREEGRRRGERREGGRMNELGVHKARDRGSLSWGELGTYY